MKKAGYWLLVALGVLAVGAYLYQLIAKKNMTKAAVSPKQGPGPERLNEGFGDSQGQVR